MEVEPEAVMTHIDLTRRQAIAGAVAAKRVGQHRRRRCGG